MSLPYTQPERIVHIFKEFHNVVKIVERFAHTHKHNVRNSLTEVILNRGNLTDYLARR